jgi:hypothetical protein
MAATISTVPAVIDELVSRFSQSVTDAQVCDALPRDDGDGGDYIFVGFAGVDDQQAATNSVTIEQMASAPGREQYTISCLVSAWRGVQDDVKLVRDRAYELLDAMAAELARDQTLGGLVVRATLTAASLDQYFSQGGVSVDIRAVISADAFTRRP